MSTNSEEKELNNEIVDVDSGKLEVKLKDVCECDDCECKNESVSIENVEKNEKEKRENDNEDEKEQDEVYVLSVNNKPVFFSRDYHEIRRRADGFIRETSFNFTDVGNIFVTVDNDTYTLSFLQHNFFWKTERILQVITIDKVKEI